MPVNMGHCRFYNTLLALKECKEHMEDSLSEPEEKAKRELVRLCDAIAYENDDEA